MVLGLRSKNKKGASVQLDYIVHLQEIKPWPPSQSLRSLRAVVLQWENGDRNSGATAPVAPSLGDGKIEFNEPFRLHVTLSREAPGRGGGGNDSGAFQKNVLELNLYEPRRDKAVKGQHLGSAAVDLAEHGVIGDPVSVGVPLSCKRSFRNTAQPVVYLRIQPLDKDGSGSSSRGSLSKEGSLDRQDRESVSALMTGEYADEAEIASFTDDEASSHSSPAQSSPALEAAADLPPQNGPGKQAPDENVSQAAEESGAVGNVGTNLAPESVPAKPEMESVTKASTFNDAEVHQNGILPKSLLLEVSGDPERIDNTDASSSRYTQTLVMEKEDTPGVHPSSSVMCEVTEEEILSSKTKEGVERDDLQEVQENMVECMGEENVVENHVKKENGISGFVDRVESSDTALQKEKLDLANTAGSEPDFYEDKKFQESGNSSDEVSSSHGAHDMFVEENIEHKQIENGSEKKTGEAENRSIENDCLPDSPDDRTAVPVARVVHSPVRQNGYLQNTLEKPLSDMASFSRRVLVENGNSTSTSDRLENMFSIRSNPEMLGSITYATNDQYLEDVKEIDVLGNVRNRGINSIADDRTDVQEKMSSSSYKVKHTSRINRNSFSSNKVRELEVKVEMLEGELREAAAIEISLFSVVAEHGSSSHKVHTPARRLSRLYIHASKQLSREKRASAARSAVSGLVLAAKACGNDVPRLTFWLSNSVVLRAIVTQSITRSNLAISVGPYPAANGSGVVLKKKSSPLKWESPRKKEFSFTEDFDDWEDPYTFTNALERIEAWIFSRIIESMWWQALAPHMQPINEPKVRSHLKKGYGRTPSLGDQQQANSSIEIWNKAFKDACERLCPVRAGGHECGCLPILPRLVMEQCVERLDVAMFNAILRESDDEIPTDPVSDPISDAKVLPIPSGRLSFGAGAQLKNAIGNWSRWLSDLFGMDAEDYPQDENEEEDDRVGVASSFKSFHLLNALSDLLMLPKDMLLERSIRKEVCPAFSASMIKRILSSFFPDEFCPDPIPDMVLEALDSEDPLEGSDDGIRNFPCNASPITYSPPPIALIEGIIGDVRSASLLRSGSSVVRKCHTSDDELDEMDSPLAAIVIDKSSTPTARSKGNGGANAVRYQLLREVWRDD